MSHFTRRALGDAVKGRHGDLFLWESRFRRFFGAHHSLLCHSPAYTAKKEISNLEQGMSNFEVVGWTFLSVCEHSSFKTDRNVHPTIFGIRDSLFEMRHLRGRMKDGEKRFSNPCLIRVSSVAPFLVRPVFPG